MSAAIRIVLVDARHPGNIGASARAMSNKGLDSLVLVRPQSHDHAEAAAPAAVLFGGETNGLGNEDLARCQALLRMPASPAYASLNLAQAVQIVCYEIRMARDEVEVAVPRPAPATADEKLALGEHVERVMCSSGFMHDANAAQLGPRVRRLLARAQTDAGEVRILRGWLAAIERRLPPAQ